MRPASAEHPSDDFSRCLAFVQAADERSVTDLVPFSHGHALIDRAHPVVWDVNFLRVEREGATWRQLARAADEIQGGAGLGHRKIVLPDAPWAEDLCNAARREGWEATALIYMIRRRSGTRLSEATAREVAYEEVRKLREELARRQPWATEEEDVRQVLEVNQRRAERLQGRFFIADVDGEPAAACDLYRGAGLAQIEDVETKAEHRNRGLATAVVLAAAQAAGEDQEDPVVFLIADENDWPKVLYERLGFETVGRTLSLLRTNLD